MDISRRDFLKWTGATAGGLLLGASGAPPAAADERIPAPLHKKVGEITTICTWAHLPIGGGLGCKQGIEAPIDPSEP